MAVARYQNLFEAAKEAQKKAYAKYSQFYVGAALQLKSGRIYSGCNIENASFGATVCAERVAIWKMLSDLGAQFKKEDVEAICLVTSTAEGDAPCGMCLQVMSEFFPENTQLLIANETKILAEHRWEEFLPHAFELKK